jgi:hypothetical protein
MRKRPRSDPSCMSVASASAEHGARTAAQDILCVPRPRPVPAKSRWIRSIQHLCIASAACRLPVPRRCTLDAYRSHRAARGRPVWIEKVAGRPAVAVAQSYVRRPRQVQSGPAPNCAPAVQGFFYRPITRTLSSIAFHRRWDGCFEDMAWLVCGDTMGV